MYHKHMPQSPFEKIKTTLRDLPKDPGCYLFKDKAGKIFYIGKAINLQNRIRSYFSGQDTRYFVAWLKDILGELDTIVVHSNKEALLLEQTLIQKHQPKFNVMLKDDKNFLMLKLARSKASDKKEAKFPRLDIVRKVKKDHAQYFGPYPSASDIRATTRLINKHFLLRTCTDKVLNNRTRPCIQHQIGRCLAPCVYEVDDYQDELDSVEDFLKGKKNKLIDRLKIRMSIASDEENFELAAKLRDNIAAIKESLQSQSIRQAGEQLSADVFSLKRAGKLVCIAHLKLQKGKITGITNHIFENQPFPTETIFPQFIQQCAVRSKDIAPLVLLSDLSEENCSDLSESLKLTTSHKIQVSMPQRGFRRALLSIAEKNAALQLKQLKAKSIHANESMLELKQLLQLQFTPTRMECFDNSLFQGTDAVASQVVFTEGVPNKKEYRKYTIKTVEGTDDFAMMQEVVGRRLKKGIEQPTLILVDGGKGQLSSALKAAREHGLNATTDGPLYMVGIAKARTYGGKDNLRKSEERLFLPNISEPVVLQKNTLARHLVEQIRDEAHRFAITFHRNKRSKRNLSSEIDSIYGLGPKSKKKLLLHFGSVRKIRAASEDEVANVVGKKLAEEIVKFLR